MAKQSLNENLMDKIVSLARRRGFIFPSSDIYGGLSSCWDYGPLGVEMKRNVKEAWWQAMVHQRDDMVGLDTSILMHPDVWQASGHLDGFSDPMVDCKDCKMRWRSDDMEDTSKCPSCGGQLTEPRQFNLMFKTFMGPMADSSSTVYLRPETAQGIFVNFRNVLDTTRKKLPFGIAQIGKSFRNEITTGNFIFRSREFEQMEIEYFVKPGNEDKAFNSWCETRLNWYLKLGIKKEHLRLRPHGESELAHYAKGCYDIEYLFPMGWSELEGIANRADYDLKQHASASNKNLDYFDNDTNEHYLPYVIEPSAGVERSFLAFLLDAYDEETNDKGETRVVLRFNPSIAPYKAAILPLSRKEPLVELSKKIHKELSKRCVVMYDDTQSIGRRYRRQDEIGTPLCVTVDFESLEDNCATIRDRDTMKQIRVPVPELDSVLKSILDGQSLESHPLWSAK